MSYTISTGNKVDIIHGPLMDLKVRHIGAEPISLKMHHPVDGDIGILLNDDLEKKEHHYWKSHAPFLFPIVGGLVGGKSTTTDGKEIVLGGHGFARKAHFTLCDHGADDEKGWLEYYIDNDLVHWNEENSYPWKFRFGIRFVVAGNELSVSMIVKNCDTSTMWYQMGWHPGFHTPVNIGRGSRNDVALLLPSGTAPLHECDRDSFLTGAVESVVTGGLFPFTDKGLDYTYVLDMTDYKDRYAALRDPHSGITTTVRFPDLPHLGLWAMPDSPYICIEPWQGADDYAVQTPFDKKFGVASLPPGGVDTRTMTVTVDMPERIGQ